MSRSNLMLEKATTFDVNSSIKHEVAIMLGSLKEFRQKFRFTENLREIEWLDPDKLFKINPDEIGEFFNLLDRVLKPVVHSNIGGSNVYRNTRLQISEFKNLLRTVVDDRNTLAQKVDARWERIGGLGQYRQLVLKIIYIFNYENEKMLPIFSTLHLRHFVNRVADHQFWQTKYSSLGQEYEHYTNELLKAKNSVELTKGWNNLFFIRFLYQNYPPPDIETVGVSQSSPRKTGLIVTDEHLEMQGFMKLLAELQKQGKITGEEFRENRTLWMQQPSERQALMQRLKRSLNQ